MDLSCVCHKINLFITNQTWMHLLLTGRRVLNKKTVEIIDIKTSIHMKNSNSQNTHLIHPCDRMDLSHLLYEQNNHTLDKTCIHLFSNREKSQRTKLCSNVEASNKPSPQTLPNVSFTLHCDDLFLKLTSMQELTSFKWIPII